jgi:hypothetical protein
LKGDALRISFSITKKPSGNPFSAFPVSVDQKFCFALAVLFFTSKMMARPALFIFFSGTLRVIAFLILQQPQIAG